MGIWEDGKDQNGKPLKPGYSWKAGLTGDNGENVSPGTTQKHLPAQEETPARCILPISLHRSYPVRCRSELAIKERRHIESSRCPRLSQCRPLTKWKAIYEIFCWCSPARMFSTLALEPHVAIFCSEGIPTSPSVCWHCSLSRLSSGSVRTAER